MTTSLDDLRYELALANRIIAHEGVLDGFGHVSVRHPDDPGRYLLARSRSPELIEPSDLLEFTLDSEPVTPPKGEMYGERVIHGCIYQARPDVNAVCHHHSHAVLPFCVTGIALEPVFHMGPVMGQVVPMWDSRDEFGDTDLMVVKPEEGRSLARDTWPELDGADGAPRRDRRGPDIARAGLPHCLFARQRGNPVARDGDRQDRRFERHRTAARRAAPAAAAADGAGLGVLDDAIAEGRRIAACGEIAGIRAEIEEARQ